jgi:hypothetical protein
MIAIIIINRERERERAKERREQIGRKGGEERRCKIRWEVKEKRRERVSELERRSSSIIVNKRLYSLLLFFPPLPPFPPPLLSLFLSLPPSFVLRRLAEVVDL